MCRDVLDESDHFLKKKKATGKEVEKTKCKVMRPDSEVLTGGTEKDVYVRGVLREKTQN